MSPSSAGLPFCSSAVRYRSRPGANEVPDAWRPAVWPANRSARPRSTSRFAGGRAFPGRGPSRVLSGRRQPTSAWVSSGCLCRPDWRRSASPADGVPDAVRVPCGGACIDRLTGVPRGRPVGPVTVHAIARVALLRADVGKLESKGFSYGRWFAPSAGLPRTCARGRHRGQRLSARRRSSRARREDNSPGFLLPSRV